MDGSLSVGQARPAEDEKDNRKSSTCAAKGGPFICSKEADAAKSSKKDACTTSATPPLAICTQKTSQKSAPVAICTQKTSPAICSQKSAPAKSSQEVALAKSSQEVAPAKSSQKQQDSKKVANGSSQKQQVDKNTAAKEPNNQPNKGATIAAAWTHENPNFKFGKPMLSPAELKRAGPATAALHSHYLKGCTTNQKNGIVVTFKRNHFLGSRDSEFFLVGFNDLYDLFNFDGLDVSLLHCYTLSMVVETKENAIPMGFLDPELMSISTLRVDKSYVVEYVRKALNHFARKECIMFAHNPGGHWILVVVIPKWNKVLYLDSNRSRQRDISLLKSVLDEAFLSYATLQRMDNKKLVHVTKFPATSNFLAMNVASIQHTT
ncbi:hypothetical protein EJB05_15249, partial [Eragrostis curvula]